MAYGGGGYGNRDGGRGGGGRGGFGRGGGGGGFRRDNFGPREMHKITCSECGNEGTVPFKPRQGTPVYCRDCFAKKNGRTPRNDAPSEEQNSNSEEN